MSEQSSQTTTKHDQPGINCNKSKVWFFLQLYICSLTKKSPKSKGMLKELQEIELRILTS